MAHPGVASRFERTGQRMECATPVVTFPAFGLPYTACASAHSSAHPRSDGAPSRRDGGSRGADATASDDRTGEPSGVPVAVAATTS
eukprot:7361268-Prymnesium_polylepis.1